MKRLTIFFSFICIAFCMLATPQVRVQKLDKKQLQQALTAIGKITFNDGKIQVYSIDNELLISTELTEDSNIVIDELQESVSINDGEQTADYGIVTNLDENRQIRLYPNPATDVIFINGLTENSIVRLYGINGSLIRTIMTSADVYELNVEDLAKGTYLLQVNNELLKLVKE